MSRLSVLALITISLIAGACSDASDSPETQSISEILDKLDPCDLLTAEDIEAVTGQAMQPGEETHDAYCTFKSIEKTGPFDLPKYTWFVYHMWGSVPLEQAVKSDLEDKRSSLGDEYHATEVSGIGERALWEKFTGVTQLTVFQSDGAKATHTFSIQPNFKDEEQMLEPTKALAKRVLRKL